MFIEEALCVALHPSAHSVLVGFTDKLRLFTVLLDDFKCEPQCSLAITARDMCGTLMCDLTAWVVAKMQWQAPVRATRTQILDASRFWSVCRGHGGMPLGGADL